MLLSTVTDHLEHTRRTDISLVITVSKTFSRRLKLVTSLHYLVKY